MRQANGAPSGSAGLRSLLVLLAAVVVAAAAGLVAVRGVNLWAILELGGALFSAVRQLVPGLPAPVAAAVCAWTVVLAFLYGPRLIWVLVTKPTQGLLIFTTGLTLACGIWLAHAELIQRDREAQEAAGREAVERAARERQRADDETALRRQLQEQAEVADSLRRELDEARAREAEARQREEQAQVRRHSEENEALRRDRERREREDAELVWRAEEARLAREREQERLREESHRAAVLKAKLRRRAAFARAEHEGRATLARQIEEEPRCGCYTYQATASRALQSRVMATHRWYPNPGTRTSTYGRHVPYSRVSQPQVVWQRSGPSVPGYAYYRVRP